jgi:hypothetical protein
MNSNLYGELCIRGKYQALCAAQFFKRMSFEDAYQYAEGGTKDERKDYAYSILEGIEDIQKALENMGFCPR